MLLITGAGGFIGRQVTAVLAGSGGHFWALRDRRAMASVLLAEEMRRRGVTAVIHLACPSRAAFVESPASALAELARLDDALLEACRGVPSLTAVVVAGSAAVYGDHHPAGSRCGESIGLSPVTDYGRAKAGQERRWLEAGLATRVVIARAHNVTGPGEPASLVGAALARRIAALAPGGILPVANSESVRDFLDVRDVARALVALAGTSAAGPINVCSGEPVSVEEFAERLVAASGRSCQPAADGRGTGSRSVGDPSRLWRATSWRRHYPLEESLAAVWREALEREVTPEPLRPA